MTLPLCVRNTFQFLWEDRTIAKQFRSGVSLHSHTMYSEENLDVLIRHVGRIPILSRTLPNHIDYGRAFWTPPLSPRQAYRLEEKQIQRQLHLPALVSLTDHDNIQAGTLLHVMERYQRAPISVEWTVPFGCTFFHIGVHNLPRSDASRILQYLEAFTACPNTQSLQERLSFLNAHREVLLVLNHPLWDEKGIGSDAHAQELHRLVALAGPNLHALELNGLRSWAENRNIIRIAGDAGLAVVSGGDRHGCEPNAILNLSEASSFSEFVEEVRKHRRSHVIFMPQCRQPLNWRTMQTVVDILRDYPSSFAGRRAWTERVFYRTSDTTTTSMASLFPECRAPLMFKAVSTAVRLIQRPGVPELLRILMSAREPEWRPSDVRTAGCGPLNAGGKLPA